MIIDKISFTGADNKTNIQELKDLQTKNPRIEWAILYFPERDGDARNPTIHWRDNFYRAKMQSAMHLCGSGINQFAKSNPKLLSEIENFQRIQINLKPQWANTELVKQLIEQCARFPDIKFITQHNISNIDYIPLWQEVANHEFLFDNSLGKGVCPDFWPIPLYNKSCGYAGGLSPDNIKNELIKIAGAVNKLNPDYKTWVDMESGVRTLNEFDLSKVLAVIEAI